MMKAFKVIYIIALLSIQITTSTPKLRLYNKSFHQDERRTKKDKENKDKNEETICRPPRILPSNNTHLSAHSLLKSDKTPTISRIAFSSCMVPTSQTNSCLWKHVRYNFRPDLWIWLGDNMYADGTDMDKKRLKYNEVRDDRFYSTYGPIARPRIPVMGGWDDHDFGFNDVGGDYDCKLESQVEYCIHFDIPKSDPRCTHLTVDDIEQKGIYASIMYPLPTEYRADDATIGGIHVINLDTRTDRHHINTRKGEKKCYRRNGGESATDIISSRQWNWLEEELLTKKSEIKIITSGIQVLPPTNLKKDRDYYCAYDGENGTFERAIDAVDEGIDYRSGDKGTLKEVWADVPQSRMRLLQLAQRSINTHQAKKVIFLSGNIHMGEILVKKMPPSFVGGDEERILYEVTASGVGKEKYRPYPNTNRVRLRTCDDRGNGRYSRECDFPFIWRNKTYNDCTTDTYNDNSTKRDGRPWCYFRTKDDGRYEPTDWGYCLPEEEELVPRENQFVSERTCGRSYHHLCGMKNIYGGVSVDWGEGLITLSIFAPEDDTGGDCDGDLEAIGGASSSINITFVPDWMNRDARDKGNTTDKEKVKQEENEEKGNETAVGNNNHNYDKEDVDKEKIEKEEDKKNGNETAVGSNNDNYDKGTEKEKVEKEEEKIYNETTIGSNNDNYNKEDVEKEKVKEEDEKVYNETEVGSNNDNYDKGTEKEKVEKEEDEKVYNETAIGSNNDNYSKGNVEKEKVKEEEDGENDNETVVVGSNNDNYVQSLQGNIASSSIETESIDEDNRVNYHGPLLFVLGALTTTLLIGAYSFIEFENQDDHLSFLMRHPASAGT